VRERESEREGERECERERETERQTERERERERERETLSLEVRRKQIANRTIRVVVNPTCNR
jgi:hypothetical protein